MSAQLRVTNTPPAEQVRVETVLSMLTTVCHLKKVAHQQADYFRARMALILSAFNLLVQGHGLSPDEQGMVHLSVAEFSL